MVRKEGVQPCTGCVGGAGEQGAASFTFTLSSETHGKALLALAAVGARGVDASLSPAGRGLLTLISIWQQTGRQSLSLPPPACGRLGAGEELLHLQRSA